MPIDIPPEVRDLAPGGIGSAIAAFFMHGTPWPQRIAMALGGTAAAFYTTKPIAVYFGFVDAQGAIGFILGLFAMGLIRKTWEAIDQFKGGELLMAWLRKIAGLPPKGDPNG